MTPEREAELRLDLEGPAHINPGRLVAQLREALDSIGKLRALVYVRDCTEIELRAEIERWRLKYELTCQTCGERNPCASTQVFGYCNRD